MKIVGVIVARMTSSRFPGKVLADLGGRSSLNIHIERMQCVTGISEIFVATSSMPENKPIIDEANRLGVQVYKGSDEDIVERFLSISRISAADALVRVGCDKPLFCFELLQQNVESYDGEDFVHFSKEATNGITHEIVSRDALEIIHEHYSGTAVTQYIRQYPHKFRSRTFKPDSVYCRPEYRLSFDTVEDYQMLKVLFDDLKDDKPIHTKTALVYLDDNPEVGLINTGVREKNVNEYGKKIESQQVFMVIPDELGKYKVIDRMGNTVSYSEFAECVAKRGHWH